MPCRKSYDKLWNNYLTKYGDFRERLQTIRNDQQCFMQFQLPRLLNVRIPSSTSVKKTVIDDNNRKLYKKYDPLLPSECYRSSMIKNNLSFILNQTELDELEKLIQAEDFPNNIFPVNTEPRSSIDNETELSVTNNIVDDIHSRRLTSSLNSIFSKNIINHSMMQSGEGSSIYPLSNRSMQKSEHDIAPQLRSSSHDPTTNRIINPYAQLVERLRRAEKTKLKNFDTPIDDHKSFDSTIDANIHNRIQNLLSFLHSLDDITDNKQNLNIFDENTLIALFSVDNHLSSSIYVPKNIHQLNIIPKTILHSLRNTSDNKHILSKIQDEISLNKIKELKFKHLRKQQSYSNDDFQTSNFIDQDNELNSRLFNTYTVKAFKEFLIHHNKSPRLPKLFHDINL